MLTIEQYAAEVVERFHIEADVGSSSHRAADRAILLLKEWAGQYLAGITISGAYAKNTAVRLSSHVDLLVTLDPVPGMGIKQVYWRLYEFLNDRNLRPKRRTVSLQMLEAGDVVDVVPAYVEKKGSLLSLFNNRVAAEVKTAPTKHVQLITNSGRQQEICALKIWRELHTLDFPSLYLELTVLHALERERYGQLADNVMSVLRYLGRHFEESVVEDPANRENIVSNDVARGAKREIAEAARQAVYEGSWQKILW